MGATPSHEDDAEDVADPEDSDDDDDIIKMQNGRFRVSVAIYIVSDLILVFLFCFVTNPLMSSFRFEVK